MKPFTANRVYFCQIYIPVFQATIFKASSAEKQQEPKGSKTRCNYRPYVHCWPEPGPLPSVPEKLLGHHSILQQSRLFRCDFTKTSRWRNYDSLIIFLFLLLTPPEKELLLPYYLFYLYTKKMLTVLLAVTKLIKNKKSQGWEQVACLVL